MTNQNAQNNAPVEKNPQAQGKRDLANKQDEKPVANWRVRALAVATICGAVSCGGSGETNDPILPNNPLPPGVCSNLEGRITEVGITSVNLDEAILQAGENVKLGSDDYKLNVLGVSARNEEVIVVITDKDGTPVAFLQDQNGEEIANLNSINVGDSWTFVLPDGKEISVTVCAIVFDLEGNAYAVLESDGFDWCTTVDRTVENTEDYEGLYGTQHIEQVLYESGETEDRTDAQCMDLNREIVEETSTLELLMLPGVQPSEGMVKVLGEEWVVISLSNSGYILLGKSAMSGEIEVGETLLGDGVTVLVNEVSLYGDSYAADLSITVDGVSFEVIEGARAWDVFKVTDSEGKDLYIRVIRVTPDGKVELEILKDAIKLQDGGTYTDKNGNVWSVSLTMPNGSITGGVEGWHLVKQE